MSDCFRFHAKPKSCVFWDVQDFPIPSDVNPADVIPHTKWFLHDMGYLGSVNDLSVKTYAENDIYGVSYRDVGIETHSVPGDDYSRVDRMLVDIVLWALENPATYFKPVDLVVLSQHVIEGSNFLHALEALQDRYYNVVLIREGSPFSTQTRLVINSWPSFSIYLLGRNHNTVTFPNRVHNPKTASFPETVVFVANNITADIGIVIFLDAKGCPTTKHSEFSLFAAPCLQEKGYYGGVQIMAYLDKGEPCIYWSDIILEITFVTKCENRDAKITKMLLDMLFWAMNNEDRTNFLIISKPPSYMSQPLWDNVVRVLESKGSKIIFPPSDIELPLSRSTFESICKGTRLVLPFTLDEPSNPKLESFKYADYIGVFWLANEFPSDPMIVDFIHSCMAEAMETKGYFGTVLVKAYVNHNEWMSLPTNMTLSYLPEGNKYEKVSRIMADMFFFARNHGVGTSLIVVSPEPFKDTKFDSFCESLRGNHFNVVHTNLDYFVTFGTAVWSSRIRMSM